MKSDLLKINTLSVKLYNQPIGMINRLAGDRYIFSFEQEYVDNPTRPTLSLSYKSHAGGLITSARAYSLRLPPFFSNLLPEGHLRNYLAQRAGIKPEREFFLLAALGEDLPGALTVTPVDDKEDIEQSPITNNKRSKNAQNIPLRFSLAGVQLKFSAVMEASGGLTIPADGFGGSWIIKLPSARFVAVPENEFVMLALARKIGISLPQNRLVEIKEIHGLPEVSASIKGKALAIKRFDRGENGLRIHMEDFAQIFGQYPDYKYEKRSYSNIAAVLWAETGETGTYQFLRRLIFSILIGNADMHLKNWSLIYPDTRTPELSPAYDFVATLPYIPGDHLALNFGGNRSFNEINSDQIRRFADTAQIPVSPLSQLIIETVEKTVTAWQTLSEKDLLPKQMVKLIDRQILTVAKNTQRL